MSNQKPAIVIVPGAWHVPAHYSLLHNALSSAGYEVTTCDMPSAGPPEPLPDMSQDVAVVQKAMQSYIDQGLNVVLVMHSLGGVIGTSACKGFRAEDQTSGKGVTALVYLTAFAPQEGATMMAGPDSKHAPWVRTDGKAGTGVFMYPDNPPYQTREVFYNDCKPEAADMAMKGLKMQYSESVCHDPCPYAAWKEIESNYLICEIDNAIPPAVQEMLAGQEGGRWKRVERMYADHSPFLSRPEETAAFVRKCAGEEL